MCRLGSRSRGGLFPAQERFREKHWGHFLPIEALSEERRRRGIDGRSRVGNGEVVSRPLQIRGFGTTS